MSEELDPLEAELAALTPRGVSPEMPRGVAERLSGVDGDAPPARSVSDGGSVARRLRSGLVVLGVLTAVGVIAVLGPAKKDPATAPRPPVVEPVPPPAESPDAGPSVLAYQRALNRSPDDLTALLDKHAAGPDPVRVTAFTRSNTTLDALLGDD